MGQEASSTTKARTILIVDDDSEILSAYARLLRRSLDHVKVVTAASAIEGLKVISRVFVDVILADYRMPEMDGIEFLAEARRINPRIRRVIFTAFAEPDLARRAAAEAVVDDFISKDIDPMRLVERVQNLLARRRG